MKAMKQLNILLFAGLIAGMSVSCDSYLDTPPVDQIPTEGFYKTLAQADQGIIGIYGDLHNAFTNEYWFMSECRSDIAWIDPSKVNAFRQQFEISKFTVESNLDVLDGTWNMWYKVIYDANTAIEKITANNYGNEKVQKQLLNEAYFLRGWAYFELTRLFGNVPLIERPMSTEEVKTVKQSKPLDIIKNRVIPDLLEAENLPYTADLKNGNNASASSVGRADKLAAKCMLARVYMTLLGFPYNETSYKESAKTLLKEILEDSHATAKFAPTIDEWRKQWIPSDAYYNKYSVFAIQYRAGGTGTDAIYNMADRFPATMIKNNLGGGSGTYVEKSLMYEFEKEYNGKTDARGFEKNGDATNYFGVLMSYPGDANISPYESAVGDLTLDNGQTVKVHTGVYIYKYIPTKTKIASLDMNLDVEASQIDTKDWGVNYPVIRIEDMMLLYAELLVEDGDISTAMGYVNQIRNRAECDPVPTSGINKEEAMNYIKRERKLEFLGEGIRWFDEVRYGTWKEDTEKKFNRYGYSEYNANVKDGRYLYPIPLTQLNAAPGLYQQNEGY